MLNAKGKTRNVIFITFDGLRWEEVFYGADSLLINNDDFTKERKSMVKDYWADTPKTRREKLMPFFWSTIKIEGQNLQTHICFLIPVIVKCWSVMLILPETAMTRRTIPILPFLSISTTNPVFMVK